MNLDAKKDVRKAVKERKKGIKKKHRESLIQKRKKKRARQEKVVATIRSLEENQLAITERLKRQFTEVKERYNRLLKTNEVTDELRQLQEEGIVLYNRVIAGYTTLFDQLIEPLRKLRISKTNVEKDYNKVKKRVIDINKEVESQAKEGRRIVKQWNRELEKVTTLPARQRVDRLSSAERRYLRDQANLYKTLYEDATKDIEQARKLRARQKKYISRKAELKAHKKWIETQFNEYKNQGRILRAQLSTFKSRNRYITQPIEQVEEIVIEETTEEEEAEAVSPEEIIIDNDLSETEESLLIIDRIDDITEKLNKKDFDALEREFNATYSQPFLRRLIAMYRRDQKTRIEDESLTLISLLIDPRSEIIATLYEMLRQQQSKEAIILYIEEVQPPLEILDLDKKIIHLLNLGNEQSGTPLFNQIKRFIYDETEEREDEPTDVPIALVSEAENGTIEVTEGTKRINVDEVIRESHRAQMLLSAYEINDTMPLTRQTSRACIYRAAERETNRPLIIKITPQHETEAEVHQLLGNREGFVQLLQYSQLENFPSNIFTSCGVYKSPYERMNLYIMLDVPFSFAEVNEQFNEQDKLCILFELIEALQLAKLNYGIEYNNLNLENIRFSRESDETLRIFSSFNVACRSRYRVSLIDFGFVSLDYEMPEEKRLLLANDDFNSVVQLIEREEMQISPRITENLQTTLFESENRKLFWPAETVPFLRLLKTLAIEMG